MTTFKTFVTVDDLGQVILSDLPFQKGERVRVVILSEDDEAVTISQRFRKLFRETQALPGVAELTEEDILAEIAAYRRGE